MKRFWLPLVLDTFCLSSKFTLHPATLPPAPGPPGDCLPPGSWLGLVSGRHLLETGGKERSLSPLLAGWLAWLPKVVAQAASVSPFQHSLTPPFLDPAGKHTCLPAALSGTRLASGFLCGPYLAGNLSRPLHDPDIQEFWVTKALWRTSIPRNGPDKCD